MMFSEIKQDLFAVSDDYYIAHCISGDYALGAGIAKTIDKYFDMRYRLQTDFPIPDGEKFANVGKALLVDRVFNLVTKPRCYHKPTYDSLHKTLVDMRKQCEKLNITKLAMPKIASGLDKLDWNKVRTLIKYVFHTSNIEILVCEL